MIRRALLSVHDKTGLDELARALARLGVELLASGGTAAQLTELGLEVTPVETVTASPEILGGRVKTLHPRIHGGILARRDNPDDMAQLDANGIVPIDLVCVNLYPFDSVAWRPGAEDSEVIEMIDVGGPTMVRAAAKNFAHVAVVTHPAQYPEVLAEIEATGTLGPDTRRRLAAAAFAATSAYEASISTWFLRGERFPPQLSLTLRRERELTYGENPHQAAAYYRDTRAARHLLSGVTQRSGRDLSYNNLNDLWAARALLEELDGPACVIVKHANPCGAATAASIDEAYEGALASDPVSAYGGIVALNRPVGAGLAERIAGQFVEVLSAPGYEPVALETLAAKEATRVLETAGEPGQGPGDLAYRQVLGGMLVQEPDAGVDDRDAMEVVTSAAPDERLWGDLLLAWQVVKHVGSNAIVLVRDRRTIGIGAGQMSRVDSVRIAVEKAREHGHETAGAALASDAFFPFADGPAIALEAGIGGIVQPGGSKRDDEVVAAVEGAGASMIFTRRRHFRH